MRLSSIDVLGGQVHGIDQFVQHLGSMLSVIPEARDSGMSKPPSAAGIALDRMAVCLLCAGERSGDWGEGWPGLRNLPLPALTSPGYSWHIPLYYSIVLGLNVGPWAS